MSIVTEIQELACMSDVNINDLVKKTYILARKLGIKELEEWLNKEIEGYEDFNDIPKYRHVTGEVVGYNPFYGWIPVVFHDSKTAERYRHLRIGQSIMSLPAPDEKGIWLVPYSQKIQNLFSKATNFHTNYALKIYPSNAKRIIEGVKQKIIDWTLILEEMKIDEKRQGSTYEEKEEIKDIDTRIQYIFQGNIYGFQMQQGTIDSTQVMRNEFPTEELNHIINEIKKAQNSFGLQQQDNEKLSAAIRVIEEEVNSGKPRRSIVKGGLSAIKEVLKEIIGNVVAAGIFHYITNVWNLL